MLIKKREDVIHNQQGVTERLKLKINVLQREQEPVKKKLRAGNKKSGLRPVNEECDGRTTVTMALQGERQGVIGSG